MSWWNWQEDEPNEFSCGRITRVAWAENDCTDEIKYICQRGTITHAYAYTSVHAHLFKSKIYLLRLFCRNNLQALNC